MQVGEALAAFRASGSEGDRNRLAQAIRVALVRMARYGGVPERAIDDVVQDATIRVIEALLAGAAPDKADAYVNRAGVNAAIDWHRRRTRRRVVEEVVAAEDLDRVPAAHGDDSQGELLDRVKELLWDRRMPPTYAAVIEAHYLRGEAIEDLARRELEERPVSKSGEARTFDQARQTVDQRLTRARARLVLLLREDGLDGGSG